MNVTIIIPTLDPDDRLPDYVQALIEAGENRILVVNDGSKAEKNAIFARLAAQGCTILHHAVNMGKGRALKDAFNYCMTHRAAGDDGVITVDSDGQHTVEDVLRMKEALSEAPDALILGARDFSRDNVPPKSAFGNKVTRTIIRLLYGGQITDTQTGLRALSYRQLPSFLTLPGERFEYETGMLLEALQKNIPIREIRIQTIYYEENKGTHFNPLADSWKIYKLIFGVFIKYTLSSFSSSLVDMGVFQLFTGLLAGSTLGAQVWVSTILARVISSLYNYLLNKKVVFRDSGKGGSTLLRYYALCVCQMCASATLVYIAARAIGLPHLVIKIFVDTVLFFVSFRIQKKWVFGEREKT